MAPTDENFSRTSKGKLSNWCKDCRRRYHARRRVSGHGDTRRNVDRETIHMLYALVQRTMHEEVQREAH